MAERKVRSQLNRRTVLKLGGAATVAGLLSRFGSPSPIAAQSPPPMHPLRDPHREIATRDVGPPPLPPLGVIVFNRLAFGPRKDDIGYFNSLGGTLELRLPTWLDQQLDPASIDDSECDTRIANAGFTTLNKSLTQLWQDHYLANVGWQERIRPTVETQKATMIRAVYSKRQLFEVLVDFWHNHFNVDAWISSIVTSTFVYYDRDVIRAHALGNFREMLEAVAKSPAMLYYLDNYISQDAGFNENYARELLELHTLGAENYLGVMSIDDPQYDPTAGYVDNDVYEAARCFTGWTFDYYHDPGTTGQFVYNKDWHDRANKIFLGNYLGPDQPDEKDGKDVLDILAAHPGTARYISRKLCRRLISDDPPQDVVDAAAAVFQANVSAPDQLKQVVRTIVLHPAFSATWSEKIKRPFEYIAGILRATGADFSPSSEFLYRYERIGQELFSFGTPDGYPDVKEDWNNTTSMQQRWQLCNYLIEDWVDDVNVAQGLVNQTPGANGQRSPNQIADYWINRILARPMHPAENRGEIVDFLAQGRNPDYDLPLEEFSERVPRAVAVILMGPDFQCR